MPPVRTPAAESTTSELIKTVGQFVGAITAVAGVVYLLGGLVLVVRLLWTGKLSGVGQVSQLPKDVLISLGLEVLLIPIAIGVAYAIFRAIRRDPEAAPPTLHNPVRRRHVLPLAVVIAGPGAAAWLIAVLTGHGAIRTGHPALDALCATVIGLGILGLGGWLTWLTIRAWEKLGTSYETEAAHEEPDDVARRATAAARRWNSMGAVMVVSLLFAAASLPSWAFAAMSIPLGRGLVCPDSGKPVLGYLIGEGATRTYLAREQGRRIVSFSNDHVLRVIAGRRQDLTKERCPKATTDATSEQVAPVIHVHVAAPHIPAPVVRVHVRGDG